jgi:MFS family permease
VSTVATTRRVDAAGLAALRSPRQDLLEEVTDDGVQFRQAVGPFRHYQRRLEVRLGDDGWADVDERTEFELAIPVWRPLFTPLVRRVLRDTDRTPRRRWWWPREVVDTDTTTLIGLLVVLSVVAGYLTSVVSQTIAFAAVEFDAGRTAQGNTLAAVRVGVVLSVLATRLADRFGRRPLIVGTAAASASLTVLGAVAPSLWVLGSAQTVARGLATALATLIVVAAAEEVPAAARALAISLLALGSALGSGMVLWVLPVADLGERGWRIVYLVPLLSLPLLAWVHRHLPETRRFTSSRHETGSVRVHRGRFALLAVAAFAAALFLSPAAQFSNEFLREERGYSALAISAFRLITSTPAGLAVMLGGALADRRGRRYLGAIGLAVGAGAVAASYHSFGAALWVWAMLGTWVLGAAAPALRVYQTELFPTRVRGRVGGWLDLIAVSGSALGLVTVGVLADRWDSLPAAVTVMLVGPLVVAVLILARFPETRAVELEDLNPPAAAGPPFGRRRRLRPAEADEPPPQDADGRPPAEGTEAPTDPPTGRRDP